MVDVDPRLQPGRKWNTDRFDFMRDCDLCAQARSRRICGMGNLPKTRRAIMLIQVTGAMLYVGLAYSQGWIPSLTSH